MFNGPVIIRLIRANDNWGSFELMAIEAHLETGWEEWMRELFIISWSNNFGINRVAISLAIIAAMWGWGVAKLWSSGLVILRMGECGMRELGMGDGEVRELSNAEWGNKGLGIWGVYELSNKGIGGWEIMEGSWGEGENEGIISIGWSNNVSVNEVALAILAGMWGQGNG